MAEVLPFPLARRRGLIRKQARFYAEQSPHAAEKNLASQLRVQADALRRRGVTDDQVQAEISSLQGAIRAEVWRLVFSTGGAA